MKTFTEYAEAALRTAPVHHAKTGYMDLAAQEHDIKHAAMGLCTEAAELIDILKKNHAYGKPLDWVNFREELGDALWYLPLYCRGLNTSLPGVLDVFGRLDDMDGFSHYVIEANSYNELTSTDPITPLAFALMRTASHTSLMAKPYNVILILEQLTLLAHLADKWGPTGIWRRESMSPLRELAGVNIAKLRARYPDKFTSDAALNRDLATERKILEGGA